MVVRTPCGSCRERARKPLVRAGRWIAKHSDLTKPPAPLIRWALLLVLGLCCWAAGIPLDIKDWRQASARLHGGAADVVAYARDHGTPVRRNVASWRNT